MYVSLYILIRIYIHIYRQMEFMQSRRGSGNSEKRQIGNKSPNRKTSASFPSEERKQNDNIERKKSDRLLAGLSSKLYTVPNTTVASTSNINISTSNINRSPSTSNINKTDSIKSFASGPRTPVVE
jgi:hypothetical protein